MKLKKLFLQGAFALMLSGLFISDINGQNLRYFQLEFGSFKMFSDRGNISSFNVRLGGGNVLSKYFDVGFEVFYQSAKFSDSDLLVQTGIALLRSDNHFYSFGFTGIGKFDIIPLISEEKSVYSVQMELGLGATISVYEILTTHYMAGVSIGHEIDKDLDVFLAFRGYFFNSDKVLDDVDFDERFKDTTDNDYYRTLNAGIKLTF